ncbi:MAG TPA: adenosylcobinamide-phosphate synthase CbiB [Rubrobacteraceae bacterium]|nr:adenosylcobinamide-phosphate synthase CbiB [Rubrobacteraceae bacterium]
MPGRAVQVAAALLLDALAGEPPEIAHPTVWIGRGIAVFEKQALAFKDPIVRLAAGAALATLLPAAVFLTTRAMLSLMPRSLRWPVEVALISTTLSMRGLARAALAVERGLERGDLDAARASVGQFVGRDTAGLSASGVARAAVESVAENASDGVVAPMLYGALFGAPGALAYKAINTLDSMLGYREPPYTHLGRASARLDDLANFAPARITVLAVTALAGPGVARTACRYGPLSSSPNAGWAEATFAGALGLRLGGANTYGGVTRPGAVLGTGRPPETRDIGRAVALMRRTCLLLAALIVVAGIAGRG